MSHVVLFVYPIKLNILAKHSHKKFYKRSYIVILGDLCNAMKKIQDKLSCHKDQGRIKSVNWGGGVHIHIFRFCPTNSFEIRFISKELVG